MVDQIEIRAWVHRGVRGLIVLTLLGLLTMSLPALMTGTPALAVLGVNASPDQIAAFMASLPDGRFTKSIVLHRCFPDGSASHTTW